MKRIIYPFYGGEHDNETDSGKDCGEQRAAVKGAGHRQGMQVLGILAGLVAVMGLIAYGQEQVRQETARQEQARQKAAQQEQARKKAAQKQQARQELQEAIATVLNGQGVPQAAAYDKSRPGPPRLVLVTRSGESHKWKSSLPAEWIAKTVSEMALIVVVEDKEVKLDTQKYRRKDKLPWSSDSSDTVITRYRHDLRVEVRAAQTGILLDGFTVEGGKPEGFPLTASVLQSRIEGRRVESAQFSEALRGYLEALRSNTGSPTGRRETNPIGMTFLELGPSAFAMGSGSSGGDDERPVHRVTISRAFYLQTTEVTQGQWRAVMGDNPAHFKNGDDHPVECVSWNKMQEFLKRLNQLDPGKNYRLPTEAEWEYACRAGTIGEHYGEQGAIAWYNENSDGQTHPVGKKQPNAWGLYDTLGNVMEWCADWYGKDYYANSPSTDPQGPAKGEFRVLRGGSWSNSGDFTRCALRSRYVPDLRHFGYYGFRCASGHIPIEQAWSKAKAQDTVGAYNMFIDDYSSVPMSEDLITQARTRIAELQPTGALTGTEYTEPHTGMRFTQLSTGSFEMGSTSGEDDKQPVHRVTISRAFYLQKTEVTQGQWRAVMGSNPSKFKNGDDYPVECVSWDDVQEFLKRLNQLDPGKNYRLPTEAEWEYACRAGTAGERYGELDAIAWYKENSGGQTHPVGKKQSNAWGLHDMLGNVREWCADWYGESYYAISPATDPKGPAEGEFRVFRGGSWGDNDYIIRSAFRSRTYPFIKVKDYGFRCARD